MLTALLSPPSSSPLSSISSSGGDANNNNFRNSRNNNNDNNTSGSGSTSIARRGYRASFAREAWGKGSTLFVASPGREFYDDDDDDDDFGARGPKKRKPKKKSSKKAKVSRDDQPNHQFLTLVNERFMVPETLFHPSDIGARQCGVPELVAQALETTDLVDEQRALCYMDVILTGGCASFPNFVERFERELRPLVSETYTVRVRRVENPITAACAGCVDIAMDRACFEASSITREEYLANKAKIKEAHASLDFAPATRTGRLREYAAQPSNVSMEHIDSECARLTPSLEREVIPAEI